MGEKRSAGTLEDVLASIQEKKEPFSVPEARSYINPYPKSALSKAKNVYAESVLPGMEAGVVALFQKCPHLGTGFGQRPAGLRCPPRLLRR